MENTSYVALSRQTALWRQMEIIATNMANVNTTAYKAEHPMFDDYLVKTKTADSAFGRKVAFTQDVGLVRDTREGSFSQTNAPLDVAIHGDGYFVLDTPAGPRYTRDGHFQLDGNGMVVNSDGYAVLQKNGRPIVIAPNESQISIASDGTVSTENGVIANVRVVSFANEQALKPIGNGTFLSPDDPTDVTRPEMVQGMLEQSNVQPIVEITNMLSAMRSYEGVQKMIETENDRQTKAFSVLSQAKS